MNEAVIDEVKDIFENMISLQKRFLKVVDGLNSDPSNIGKNSRELMTVKEVAIYLKSSEPFVRDAARSKGLPHIRIGCRTLIDREKLDEWLEAQSIN